ncbi:RNA-processing protein [Candidatus Woesearchaeota archaeon]|nr:MAG: RNA-processing protein [Candidatus Woesearchaeota archaeon]
MADNQEKETGNVQDEKSPEGQGTEYSYEIKIPKDRVAVLIGKDGETKKSIEEATKTRINIDSHDGDVRVSGKDPILLFQTREIVQAIGRGFNPEIAMLLLKQDYIFELINLLDFVRGKNHLVRVKGRIIGSEGKSRRTIESLTDTHISVYGKTVGIIGEMDGVYQARKAITALLTGSKHSSVYHMLEKFRKQMKLRRMMLDEGFENFHDAADESSEDISEDNKEE